MNAPQKVSAWAGAVVAVVLAIGAVLGPGREFIREVVAQEAQKQMAPTVAELSSIKLLLRRQDDRAATGFCYDRGKSDERCTRESEYRWEILYPWEDCDARGGDEKECGAQPPSMLPPDE